MANSASAERSDPGKLLDPVERNLRYALVADEPMEKNYHIRSALQFVEIGSEQ